MYPQNNQYNQNNYNAAVEQPNILVFGILSLVFSSIVGIILGCIGRKKGNEYIARGGTLTGASKTGYILSQVGIVLGIISTIILVIYIIFIAATLSSLKY